MGSGGSHALWPVTNHTTLRLYFKHFGIAHILELYYPDKLLWVIDSIDFTPNIDELIEGIESFFAYIFTAYFSEILLKNVCDEYSFG